MNHRSVLLALIIASLLSIVGVAQITDAQGPNPRAPRANAGTAFTYQGQLKSGGSAYNGACDFQFRLYDASSVGAQIGLAQAANSVSVSSGYFTTPIDFGASAFNGEARWLHISVRCPAGSGSYTPLAPLQQLTPAPYALALPGLYTQQNATSPNLIGGYSGNVISNTVVGGTIGGGGESGNPNRVWANYAIVGGGRNNTAGAVGAFIGGGWGNSIPIIGTNATIGGGYLNSVSGSFGTVGGGFLNTASIAYATIGGGYLNSVSNEYATVGGGSYNTASGMGSVVVGGGAASCGPGCTFFFDNVASGNGASIGGGLGNRASGSYATVPGGYNNSATMTYTLAAGRRAKANHDGAFVWGDATNADVASTAPNQFVVRATNGLVLTENAGNGKAVNIGEYYRDNAIIAWARVSSGGVATQDYGISAVSKSTGVYTITLVVNTVASTWLIPVAIAEVDSPPTSAANARLVTINQYATNQFIVYITNGSYALVDNDFVLIVTGR